MALHRKLTEVEAGIHARNLRGLLRGIPVSKEILLSEGITALFDQPRTTANAVSDALVAALKTHFGGGWTAVEDRLRSTHQISDTTVWIITDLTKSVTLVTLPAEVL